MIIAEEEAAGRGTTIMIDIKAEIITIIIVVEAEVAVAGEDTMIKLITTGEEIIMIGEQETEIEMDQETFHL